MSSQVLLYDVTLRDGSHAIRHQLTKEQIIEYAQMADNAGVGVVEVGHGIGLGASSLQIGKSLLSDEEMLRIAREHLNKSLLGIHVVPGYATVSKDISKAIDCGVDVVRVAAQCTEADTTEQHISYVREKGRRVYGGLMMAHMLSPELLVQEALKMESYGAEGITILDSAGAFLPDDVAERVKLLTASLKIPVGFHAHNNLGLAIANSLAAVKAGAHIIDGSICGFGGGAGNASIELLAAVFEKQGFETGAHLYKLLDMADRAEELFKVLPKITSSSIVSGMSGVVSVFSKPVARAAEIYNVDPRDIYFELGRRGAIAGQEDLIIEVAQQLAGKQSE
ncbi:MAG: 4-hydroxy-2-oxopentanoic acid aldolase [Sulfuricurvum sp. MLSB]|uniref:4-hydroxy-2-oxovalerate aldolase n=1 Tax=Sulfuricurvum sp. MLSB TaxID=1537917 RepID=UPI000507FB3C|nr:4-hydroxy-2-oxovalerate aldolase [Sulfuricurvum sp. MLSB]KFN39359.1 MAG: 4-hydroxy-2-oxopentanoic acid aldolase [Sulfuricurvum sp. MLSB]